MGSHRPAAFFVGTSGSWRLPPEVSETASMGMWDDAREYIVDHKLKSIGEALTSQRWRPRPLRACPHPKIYSAAVYVLIMLSDTLWHHF